MILVLGKGVVVAEGVMGEVVVAAIRYGYFRKAGVSGGGGFDEGAGFAGDCGWANSGAGAGGVAAFRKTGVTNKNRQTRLARMAR